MIKLESRPVSFYALAIIAAFVGFLRALFEYQFFGAGLSVQVLWFMPYFYFSIGTVLFALFYRVAKIDWRRSFGAVAMGIILGIFPPLIDLFYYGLGAKVRYSYNFFPDPAVYPWLFYSGPEGLPFGEAVSVWMSIVFGTIYTALTSKKILRTVAVAIALYVFFHLYMSLIPIITATWILGRTPTPAMKMQEAGHAINAVTYFFAFWYIGIAMLAYFFLRPHLLVKLAHRLLHILPFTLISLFGSAIADQPPAESAMNAVCLSIVFYILTLENDYFDNIFENKPGGSGVNRHDIAFFRIIIVLIVSWLAFLGHLIGLLYLLIYFAGVIYHMPQYRARRYFAAGMKIEGMWGWLSYLSGTLLVAKKNPQGIVLLYGLFIFLGWSLISVFKDMKDLTRDRRSGSESLYLFLRRKGISLHTSHRFFTAFSFLCLELPAVLLLLRHEFAGAATVSLLNLGLLLLSFRKKWFGRFKQHLALISGYVGCLIFWRHELL